MEAAVKTLFTGLAIYPSELVKEKQKVYFSIPNAKPESFSFQMRCTTQGYRRRENRRCFRHVCTVLSGEDVGISSSRFEDFSVTTRSTNQPRELKISVEVSGAKTRVIFDNVFDKMVASAQPIPGFRRVKGGKTPDIPRDILLEVLGPSKVYKEVIKKVINSTVAEYVEKESLKVNKDLRVEQSFEELEDAFEPDEGFSFDAVVELQETN